MTESERAVEGGIGIFDSGLGGLTVVHEVMQQLSAEDVIYYGDTARVPYGNKSPETVTRYAREIADFLLGQGVKALVVACNTATAYALTDLRERYGGRVPVMGVVEPGVRAALRVTRNGRVGVIGTRGTIASGVYEQALKRLRPDVEVVALATPLLVPLVEEDWLDHEASRLIVREYIEPLRRAGVDTVILGCTHYPLLKGVLSEELGDGVRLVDSAENVARDLAERLWADGHLRRGVKREGRLKIYVSDVPGMFGDLARRFLGEPVAEVEKVVLG
ncbi:MAG: glutamate racemase [Methylacidiphilales bacterium]|nr:glutamate racemase [Candidatus Methylacidiphilales bacterium]MDW8349784.1 glutamate racemase [Verrucomicrobiae bacterium]